MEIELGLGTNAYDKQFDLWKATPVLNGVCYNLMSVQGLR